MGKRKSPPVSGGFRKKEMLKNANSVTKPRKMGSKKSESCSAISASGALSNNLRTKREADISGGGESELHLNLKQGSDTGADELL
jgi:hypothetical protein